MEDHDGPARAVRLDIRGLELLWLLWSGFTCNRAFYCQCRERPRSAAAIRTCIRLGRLPRSNTRLVMH